MGEAWSDWYAQDYIVRQGLEPTTRTRPGEVELGKYTDAVHNVIRFQPIDCPVGAAGLRRLHGRLQRQRGRLHLR